MGSVKRGLCLVAAAALLTVGAEPASAAKLKASTAATAVEKRVAVKYQRLVRGRSVEAKCRRRSAREYYCRYGVVRSFKDAVAEPEASRWKYSGVGYARQRKGSRRITVSLLPIRSGGNFAPYESNPKPIPEPDITRGEAEELVRTEVVLRTSGPSPEVSCASVGVRAFDCIWVSNAPFFCMAGLQPAQGTAIVRQKKGERARATVTSNQPIACPPPPSPPAT